MDYGMSEQTICHEKQNVFIKLDKAHLTPTSRTSLYELYILYKHSTNAYIGSVPTGPLLSCITVISGGIPIRAGIPKKPKPLFTYIN